MVASPPFGSAARDITGLEELTTKSVRDAFEETWEQYDAKDLVMKLKARLFIPPSRSQRAARTSAAHLCRKISALSLHAAPLAKNSPQCVQ